MYLRRSATGLYPQPPESSLSRHTLHVKINFNIILSSTPYRIKHSLYYLLNISCRWELFLKIS